MIWCTCLCFIAVAVSPNIFAQGPLHLEVMSTYYTDEFDESATEIVAHDPASQRIFVTNASTGSIDILSISDPENITLVTSIDLSPFGKGANSVDTHHGLVAAAVENNNKQADGKIVFFDINGNFINAVTAGALPDNVVFSPNGRYVLSANEGEPNDDFTVDPEGSVTIVDLKRGVYNITQNDVEQVGFTAYNNLSLDPSIRVNANPGTSTPAQDFEPEYIAISKNSRYAWVALQENNAVAIIDIKRAKILDVAGLGFKDHSLAGNGLDASNETPDIKIENWPIKGMYMPDAMASFKKWGRNYIVLANEGDSRDYSGYSEEVRVKDLTLDPVAFPNAAALQASDAIGRMKTTIATGDADGDGLFEEIYTYGARSFSIRRANGSLIYDSGDEFEQITAELLPDDFNSTNDENNSFKDRSDDKGPEPEAIELARFRGKRYAFIGLERVGGIMVYDITNPYDPEFVEYVNNRNFNVPATTRDAGDLGPEDLVFIKRKHSPINAPLLICASEVSGTISIFKVSSGSNHDEDDQRRLDNGNSVKIAEVTEENFSTVSVYPNPIESGILHLDRLTDARIYNIQGMEIMSVKAVDKIDVSKLKSGLYVLKTRLYGDVKFVIK